MSLSFIGFFFTIGNSAGLISSNIYPKEQGPRFIQGHAINLGFAGLTFITTSLIIFINWRDNRDRDAISKAHPDGRDVDPSRLDTEAEKQRWGYEGYTREQLMRLGDAVSVELFASSLTDFLSSAQGFPLHYLNGTM